MALSIGDRAPEIALEDQDGVLRRRDELQNKALVLFFFETHYLTHNQKRTAELHPQLEKHEARYPLRSQLPSRVPIVRH